MEKVIRIKVKNYIINAAQIILFSEEFFGKELTAAGESAENQSVVEIEFADLKSITGEELAEQFMSILDNTYKKLPKTKKTEQE